MSKDPRPVPPEPVHGSTRDIMRALGRAEGLTEGLAIGRLQGAIGMAVIIISLYALSAWLGGSIL